MFLVAAALLTADSSDRWIRLDSQSQDHAEYLDSESIRRAGAKVMLWTRRDFVAGRTTVWHEMELDCSAKTSTLIAFIRDEAGTISHNFDRPHRAAAPIAPGSVEESIFDVACRD